MTSNTEKKVSESLSSSSSSSSSNRPHLTDFESLMVGAIGGTLETSLQMPLITWKICVQEGRPYPRGIREWYRGVLVNAGSLSPITAFQTFSNSILQGLITFGSHRKLSDTETMICSGGAGALSAFIYGPVDLMVIHQQKMVASLGETCRRIRAEYGLLGFYRGIMPTIFREGFYTMGYLGVAPVIQHRLTEQNEWCRANYVGTSLISAILGGIFASWLTHPVDTAKTCVQSDLKGDKYPSAIGTIRLLYRQGGMPVLFKGVVPRTMRLCGACFVLLQVKEGMIFMKERGWSI